jgi:hypothetical protein
LSTQFKVVLSLNELRLCYIILLQVFEIKIKQIMSLVKSDEQKFIVVFLILMGMDAFCPLVQSQHIPLWMVRCATAISYVM